MRWLVPQTTPESPYDTKLGDSVVIGDGLLVTEDPSGRLTLAGASAGSGTETLPFFYARHTYDSALSITTPTALLFTDDLVSNGGDVWYPDPILTWDSGKVKVTVASWISVTVTLKLLISECKFSVRAHSPTSGALGGVADGAYVLAAASGYFGSEGTHWSLHGMLPIGANESLTVDMWADSGSIAVKEYGVRVIKYGALIKQYQPQL